MRYMDKIEQAVIEVADALKSSMMKTMISLGKSLKDENASMSMIELRNALSNIFRRGDVAMFGTCLKICKNRLDTDDTSWIVNSLIEELRHRPKNAAKFLKAIADTGLSIKAFYCDSGPRVLVEQVVKLGCVPYNDDEIFQCVVKRWDYGSQRHLINLLLNDKKHRKGVIEAAVTSFILSSGGDDLLLVESVRDKTYLSRISELELFTALKSSMKTITELYAGYAAAFESVDHCQTFFLEVMNRTEKMVFERFGKDSPKANRMLSLTKDRLVAAAVAQELEGRSRCAK